MSYEVEAIIGKRKVIVNRHHFVEYLIKWKDYPIEQSTWEKTKNLEAAKQIVNQYDRKSREASKDIKIVQDFQQSKLDGKQTSKCRQSADNSSGKAVLENKLSWMLPSEIKMMRQSTGSSKSAMKIIGMNVENGKWWFFYQKEGVFSWACRDYFVQNYPKHMMTQGESDFEDDAGYI